MKRVLLSLAVLPALIEPRAEAQVTIPVRTFDWNEDSGPRKSSTGSEEVLYETLLFSPGAPWLRVEFGACELPPGTRIEVQSQLDGDVQRLDARSLAQWNGTAAYLNGDTVFLRLVSVSGSATARMRVERLWVGIGSGGTGTESLCGSDDRVPSQDDRVCRLTAPANGNLVSVCTGWRVTNGAFVTAGHCTEPALPTVAEFHVPASTASGMLVWADSDDQYSVDPGSFTANDEGVGEDWAVFGVFENSNTGEHPNQVYGVPLRVTDYAPSTNQTVRVTGFGEDSTPASRNCTNQTSTGPYRDEYVGGSNDIDHEYFVDTTGGSSGSPILWEALNVAIGVHTNGGCAGVIQGNLGTSSEVNQLEQALETFPGPNVVYVDGDYPIDVDSDGTMYAPWPEVRYGVDHAPAGAMVSIVRGHYHAYNGNAFTITKAVTLVAPCGTVVVGD